VGTTRGGVGGGKSGRGGEESDMTNGLSTLPINQGNRQTERIKKELITKIFTLCHAIEPTLTHSAELALNLL
jgi:hypothetical protein